MPIHFTDDPDDMRLVNDNPTALLVALLLDQQFPISAAFQGPNKIAARLSAPFSAQAIAQLPLDEFVALASAKPAIHRFPKAMATRVHELCQHIESELNDDAASIWRDRTSANDVAQRLADLPGFGPDKVKLCIAVLVKRFACSLDGWEAEAHPFHDDQPRSVADIDGPAAFAAVKEWKKAQKARGLDKDDTPLPS